MHYNLYCVHRLLIFGAFVYEYMYDLVCASVSPGVAMPW